MGPTTEVDDREDALETGRHPLRARRRGEGVVSAQRDLRLAPSVDHSTRGDLCTLRLAEVAQMISLGGKTARVSLRARNETGEIWFESGTATHAGCGHGMSGTPAFYHMLGWKEGEFVIEYGISTEKRSIEGDVMYHVLEGLRRIDEAAEPVADPAPAASEPAKRRATWSLMALIPTLAVLAGVAAWWSVARTRGSTDSAPLPAVTQAAATTDQQPSAPVRVPTAKSIRTTTRPAAAKPVTPKQRSPEKAEESPTSTVETPEGNTESTPLEPLEYTPAPVPGVLEEHALEAVEAATAPPDASLGLSIRSKLGAGTLSVIVDGQTVYSAPLTRTAGAVRRFFQGRGATAEERFGAQIRLSPGLHRLSARIQMEDGSEVQTAEITVEGEPGATRELSVIAGAKRTQPIAVELR